MSKILKALKPKVRQISPVFRFLRVRLNLLLTFTVIHSRGNTLVNRGWFLPRGINSQHVASAHIIVIFDDLLSHYQTMFRFFVHALRPSAVKSGSRRFVAVQGKLKVVNPWFSCSEMGVRGLNLLKEMSRSFQESWLANYYYTDFWILGFLPIPVPINPIEILLAYNNPILFRTHVVSQDHNLR